MERADEQERDGGRELEDRKPVTHVAPPKKTPDFELKLARLLAILLEDETDLDQALERTALSLKPLVKGFVDLRISRRTMEPPRQLPAPLPEQCSLERAVALLEQLGYSPPLVQFLTRHYLLGATNDEGSQPWGTAWQQKCKYLFPGLRSGPFYPNDFLGPVVSTLESAFPQIKEELLAMIERPPAEYPSRYRSLFVVGEWRLLLFFDDHTGEPNAEMARLCPRTAEILSSFPDLVTTQESDLNGFLKLAPGSHLKTHAGYSNTRVRVHLGLRGCEGARFRVGPEERHWVEGKCFIFDDSYEHEVRHEGREDRYILAVDLLHPDLTTAERTALSTLRMPIGGHMLVAPTWRPAPGEEVENAVDTA